MLVPPPAGWRDVGSELECRVVGVVDVDVEEAGIKKPPLPPLLGGEGEGDDLSALACPGMLSGLGARPLPSASLSISTLMTSLIPFRLTPSRSLDPALFCVKSGAACSMGHLMGNKCS
jgi:hypothetical protein